MAPSYRLSLGISNMPNDNFNTVEVTFYYSAYYALYYSQNK